MTELRLSRGGFDVGLLTNNAEGMIEFWRSSMGLPLERTTTPIPGVTQHKLTLEGSVLKINCFDQRLAGARLAGYRMLILPMDEGEHRHLRDPDGNQICIVPRGTLDLGRFGVHLAVSGEREFHDFYARVLGLPQVGERKYDLGGATISFAWSPDVVRGGRRRAVGIDYLTVQVMDVLESHGLLVQRGALEDLPPSRTHTSTESTISFIRDPDGNRIEISQRPDLVELNTP